MAASMSPVWRNNVTFDPFTQPITLLAPDGTTPVTVSLADVMVLQRTASYQNISQGVQTGAASILLLALLLITGKEKRRSHVFIFNALALLLIAIRGILSFVLCTGPLFNFYRWELMYYGDIGGTKSISAAGEVLSFLITVTIEISLAMQVRIVCCNLATFKRVAINITNGIGAFVVCGLRFALMVLNITWGIVGLETSTRSQFDTISTFASATNIALVISIGISTIIFCAKLGFAIRSRRSLGMKQFGPMQIIFVMGCQTMIGPLIFTIVTYWGVKNVQISSASATLVALFLPLSAIWASANSANSASRRAADMPSRIGLGGSDFAKAGGKGSYYTDTDTTGTLVGDSPRKGHFEASEREGERERDLEMQELGRERDRGVGGVQVERAYSVRCD